MGSVCTTRSSAVDVAEPEHRDVKPLVPYIVVSSVSLSRKLGCIAFFALLTGLLHNLGLW